MTAEMRINQTFLKQITLVEGGTRAIRDKTAVSWLHRRIDSQLKFKNPLFQRGFSYPFFLSLDRASFIISMTTSGWMDAATMIIQSFSDKGTTLNTSSR